MSLPAISPQRAAALLKDGAILVDIRERDEHARERIAEAHHLPLSRLEEAELALHDGRPVIFHCRSGARTLANSPRLAVRAGDCEAFVIEGGLDGWRRAGLPVTVDRRQPIDIQRQVQIGAGALGLGGTLLGDLVSAWFFLVPAFVGTGLLFAGLTGFCGMARVLAHAPWNRVDLPAGS